MIQHQRPIALAYNLVTIKKALMVCLALNRPAVIWGGVGVGKSSLIAQLCRELQHELFDVRLSDKEPSDLGGIPFPTEQDGRRVVEWLAASNLLPFITPARADLKCIVFYDEIDRSEKQTENVALQLLLDRRVNGHELVPGARQLAAGNGTSDNGTSVLSDAAATRLVHFYVDTGSEKALDSWQGWATRSNVSPVLRGFANFRQELFMGPPPKFMELQRATPRTFAWAGEIADYCDQLSWGSDVLEPLVFGAVGQVAGREFLGYRRLFNECPKPEVIAADPVTTSLPGEFGIFFALGQQLVAVASHNCTKEDPDLTKRFATYIGRWPEEQQAHFFRMSSEFLPTIIHTPEYRAWEKSFRIV